MAFTPQQPGIYYNPPQPTQLVQRIVPQGPANPPVLSMVLWPAVLGAIALNPYPSWSAQVQCKETSNRVVQRPIPANIPNPPTRQPDQQAVPLNPYPTWGTQRAPLNTYPPQAVAPPQAPNQSPIARWSLPTWGAQSEPDNTYPPQVTLGRPLAPSQQPVPLWSIPSWGAQRSPLNAYPPQAVTPPKAPNQAPISQWNSPTWGTQVLTPTANFPFVLPWFPEPFNYEIINSWPQPTWGTQTLPTGFPPPPFIPWQPAPLDYAVLSTWPQLTWDVQTHPPVLGLFGPPLFIPGAIEPWPVHWPNPPVSQAQLRKYIESQRRAATRRARQIAAQVQEEQELRETIVRAIRGEEPEQVIEQIEKAKAPQLLKRMDRGQVQALIQALAKPYSSRPITEAEAHEIAAKIIEAIPPLPKQLALEALPDPEEAEMADLHELQSLYAQDFYERLEALQRLMRGKFN